METIKIKVWANIRPYIYNDNYFGRLDIINGLYNMYENINNGIKKICKI